MENQTSIVSQQNTPPPSIAEQQRPKKVWRLYLASFILIFLAPAVLDILIDVTLKALLHHPANGSSGLAAINISMLSVAVLCVLTGISLAVIGFVRSLKALKRHEPISF